MGIQLSIHDCDVKLWAALAEACEVEEAAGSKWVTIKTDNVRITFFKPRAA